MRAAPMSGLCALVRMAQTDCGDCFPAHRQHRQQRAFLVAFISDKPSPNSEVDRPHRHPPHHHLNGQTRMNILMVLTSHDQLGQTGKKTGFWLEEFAAPYYVFKDIGANVTLASPMGGQPPLDPKSDDTTAQTAATHRFKADAAAQSALATTVKLADLKAADFDAVFYPGGHGPLWDLAEDTASIALIDAMAKAGKPVAAVCHAPGVFRHTRTAGGQPLVQGKQVTGFSNAEEAAAGLADVVPFLVEDMLKKHGGLYSKAADWQAHVVVDGLLITGQNPASSEPAAQALLAKLQDQAGR
jgi:putative intracellular protease/amidase